MCSIHIERLSPHSHTLNIYFNVTYKIEDCFVVNNLSEVFSDVHMWDNCVCVCVCDDKIV